MTGAVDESDQNYRSLALTYRRLVKRHVLAGPTDAFWSQSRPIPEDLPREGWKLHVSATILSSVDVLERCLPFLSRREILFKVPAKLDGLNRLNQGLGSDFPQIGKFITVYPRCDEEARDFARSLHKLTYSQPCPLVPFDRRLTPSSSIFYRFGSFIHQASMDHDVERRDTEEWLRRRDALPDPFAGIHIDPPQPPSPLQTSYRVFAQLQNRGSGGVYFGLNIRQDPIAVCVIKEGRQHGETDLRGRDGLWRIRTERRWLHHLDAQGFLVPKELEYFETEGHGYLVLEYLGHSIHHYLAEDQWAMAERFRIITHLCDLLARLHSHDLYWRDIKAANVVVTSRGLAMVDLESVRTPDEFCSRYGFLKIDTRALAETAFHIATRRVAVGDELIPAIRAEMPNHRGYGTRRLLEGIRDIAERVIQPSDAVRHLRSLSLAY